MSKVTYQLIGLGCANCAAKIEHDIQSIDGMSEAYVDFSTSKLVFAMTEKAALPTKQFIEEIVHRYEPDVKVSLPKNPGHYEHNHNHNCDHDHHDHNHGHDHGHDHSHGHSHSHGDDFDENRERIRLFISLVLFFAGLLMKSQTSISLPLLFAAYVLSGYKVIYRSIRLLARRQWFDEHFLMMIATVGAIAIGEYPEAVAVMLFYEIGEYFQDLAVGKSRASISSLMNIRPEVAHVKAENGTTDKSPEFVKIDEIVIVKPGERVPLDGVIIKGESNIDVSALTGESEPVFLEKDHPVLSGSVVMNGVIEVRVSKRYEDSTVAKILDLVENATVHKAPTENFITKFARYYTPIVVSLAAAIIVIPTVLYGISTFDTWLYRGLIFLVISCPCALVISVPLGFFSGIGNASHHGILVKGSNYLEGLNTVDTIVFDKTGTLTNGKLEIVGVHTIGQMTNDEFMRIAKKIESHSNHPIAKAIQQYEVPATDANTDFGFVDLTEKFEELGGMGIKAFIDGKAYLAGTEKLMKEHNIKITPLSDQIGTRVYIAENNVFLGTIILKDRVKTHAESLIRAIKHRHIKSIMLTGDREEVAKEVAEALDIDVYHASLLPEDKFNHVKSLIDSGKKVAFVGDGINDAPVLAGATIGISMGQVGSDAAIEASDIVIMNDGLSSIHEALDISKYTKRIVTQNIIFAIGIKVFIMILGTVGLSSMWMAIFADVGVALLAVLNSMRVLKFKPHQLA